MTGSKHLTPPLSLAMSGVSQLNTKDVTESSVTLFWTPPPVQYDTYHVTFASQVTTPYTPYTQVLMKL